MKYAVLGAGLMGKAVAYDLLVQDDTTDVLVCDSEQAALDETVRLLAHDKLRTRLFNAESEPEVALILEGCDAAVAAVHYGFNESFTRAAIDARCHLCDLGGNNDVVDAQLALSDKAAAAGVSIVPDCGLAPGMVAVLVKWGMERFEWVDSVQIRVGGLPQEPVNALKYERLFSVEGLINEYIEPVRVLRDGNVLTIEPLTEIEHLDFPEPYGTVEAFTTSGGTSTLVATYGDRLKNLDYKTIRYQGHGAVMRVLYELGFFSAEPLVTQIGNIKPRTFAAALLTEGLPLCEKDVTLVRIVFAGGGERHELTIVDHATATPPVTSMMRMTAFPAAIVARMQATGVVEAKGVLPQERCVPAGEFVGELKRRDIVVQGIDL